ncbi:cold shock domain-containing protein [Francisellaceae bacterium]|nr:cold shock domain-containing protein [Francisellaceae bacterium]
MHSGKIKFFSKTKKFGFIICDKTKKEVFVHLDNIKHRIILMKDDEVEFELQENKGKLQAQNVEIVFG